MVPRTIHPNVNTVGLLPSVDDRFPDHYSYDFDGSVLCFAAVVLRL